MTLGDFSNDVLDFIVGMGKQGEIPLEEGDVQCTMIAKFLGEKEYIEYSRKNRQTFVKLTFRGYELYEDLQNTIKRELQI